MFSRASLHLSRFTPFGTSASPSLLQHARPSIFTNTSFVSASFFQQQQVASYARRTMKEKVFVQKKKSFFYGGNRPTKLNETYISQQLDSFAPKRKFRPALRMYTAISERSSKPSRYLLRKFLYVIGYRSGQLEEAQKILLDQAKAFPHGDRYCYNIMLHAYAQRGRVKEAFELFEEMKTRKNATPNSFSFTYLLKSIHIAQQKQAKLAARNAQFAEESATVAPTPAAPTPEAAKTENSGEQATTSGTETAEAKQPTLLTQKDLHKLKKESKKTSTVAATLSAEEIQAYLDKLVAFLKEEGSFLLANRHIQDVLTKLQVKL